MNAARRKRLAVLQAELVAIREEEQAAFDALPESIQNSERGEKMEAVIDSLEQAELDIQEARQP